MGPNKKVVAMEAYILKLVEHVVTIKEFESVAETKVENYDIKQKIMET